MRKNKFIHIAITSIMLLSSILTPQMSYAIQSFENDDAEESTEVEPENAVKEDELNDLENATGEGESGEVVNIDAQNEPVDTEEKAPKSEDDAVENNEPEDTNANSPATEGKAAASLTEQADSMVIPSAEGQQNLVTDIEFILTPGPNAEVV